MLTDKIEELIKQLKDKNWNVRWAAADILGKIGDARAIEPLIASMKDIGLRAIEVLGILGDTRGVEPLIALLIDKDGGFRKAAVESLGKLSDARAIEALGISLKDEQVFVREAADRAIT